MMRRILTGIAAMSLAFTLAPVGANAQDKGMDSYAPSRENLAAREWFQDTKFGIFLHWGLYSQLGGGGDLNTAEWIMEDHKISAAHYERLSQFFNPTDFDADAWVRSFKEAGAGYIVITAKHHDGFAMYGSKVSPYNIVDATPFKRDPMAELAEACRRHGLKLFFYYSNLDWHNTDYYPRGRTGHYAKRPNSGDFDKYLDYQDAQLTELLTNYGPVGGIWFDGWWDHEHTEMKDRWRLGQTYSLIHKLQPAALILNNHHQLPFVGEDLQGFERDLPGENSMGFNKGSIGRLPLEMSETANGTWGFNLTDDKFKSPETLVRTLVGAAGRNANLLLNTGPMPNGKIQPETLNALSQIGGWLKTYGTSIRGTRGGPIGPRTWGVTTAKDNKVYVHILDWKDDVLTLPLDRKVKSARLVENGSPIRFEQTSGVLTIHGAKKRSDEWDRVIELDLLN